jgi:hypothetical protein
MAAVADTILNRLLDGRFGATVTEVCTPDQFCGLNNIGTLEVFQPAYNAVDLVFSQGSTGWTLGALYFCTPTTNPDRIKPAEEDDANRKSCVLFGFAGILDETLFRDFGKKQVIILECKPPANTMSATELSETLKMELREIDRYHYAVQSKKYSK